MTVAPVGSGGALANIDDETGLDEFDITDAVIPRLSIVQKEAEFKDSLSNQQYDKLHVVMLGLVKQRILWHTEISDDAFPMCRSVNFEIGLPNERDDVPKDRAFPWETSGFDPADFPPDDEGQRRLSCKSCFLKEWKSHPDGKKPYCSEQWTVPLLYMPDLDKDVWVPALISFQKTGLKPLKSYLTSFARTKTPAFSAITEITLDPQRRGQTDYAVPVFRRLRDTDEDNYREYAVNFRSMKEFLHEEPGSRDEDEAEATPPKETDNTAKPPPEKKAEEPVEAEVVEEPPAEEPKAEAPVAPAGANDDDDDDLPF